MLFAIGAALKTDLDGVLRIEGLWDGISGTVTRDHMYTDATVDYDGKVTQVIVSEHQYVPWTEEKQLFEGTAQEGDVITFDEPMHTLKAEGFSILASGANWAKVSAGSGVLTGRTYLHNTRQVSKDVFSAREPNIKTVEEATLVSLVNSQACAQRLANYYRCRERVDASVVYQGEKPGDRLATYHPFDKTGVAACLESADITLSNTLKAQEKSLVGFAPKQIEQTVTYDHHEILTGNGVWEVPEGVTEVLAVLIGGGGAGFDGEDGVAGTSLGFEDTKTSNNTITVTAAGQTKTGSTTATASKGNSSAGSGGEGGLAGTPGKVNQLHLKVSKGDKIVFSCGVGGSTSGELGSDTVFGENTSSGGELSGAGYTDIISGITYAKRGVSGSAGGKGGSAGNNGETTGKASGGTGLSGGSTSKNGSDSLIAYASNYPTRTFRYSATATVNVNGAGGGGAGGDSGEQAGNNGGSCATISFSPNFPKCDASVTVTSYLYPPKAGNGGKGANGASGATFGSSGNGGGGGGGGGALGTSSLTTTVDGQLSVSSSGDKFWPNGTSMKIYATSKVYANRTSSGGPGGVGGAGAPGCIILYYGVEKKITTGQLMDKNNCMVLDRLGRRIIM